jgi:hypothetical protein
MSLDTFHFATKVLSTILLTGLGLYYSFTQPSQMDLVNGGIIGLTFCAIWFAKERVK